MILLEKLVKFQVGDRLYVGSGFDLSGHLHPKLTFTPYVLPSLILTNFSEAQTLEILWDVYYHWYWYGLPGALWEAFPKRLRFYKKEEIGFNMDMMTFGV